MTAASLPAPLLLKEVRALAPVWLAAAAAIWGSAAAGFLLGGLLAFALGAAALGTCSIGHEYTHHTLTMLLAQPLPRSRLLRSKILVLATLLLLLTVVASLVLLQADGIERVLGAGEAGRRWGYAIVALTPVLGLCVAPWLTMVCRSAMAGLVFTLAIPAGLWVIGQVARAATVGFDIDPLEYGPGFTLLAGGLLAVSAAALAAGRAMFLRLEALDAPPRLTVFPWPTRQSAAGVVEAGARDEAARAPQHPLVLFVRKELRLHSLAIVVAGLYAFGWIALGLARTDAYIAGQSFESLAGMYIVFIVMLVGTSVSAEERALGTHDWQALQPYALWKQWTVKIATAGVLALLLGIGLASLLEWLIPLIRDSGSGTIRVLGPPLAWLLPPVVESATATALVLATSVYVSSLCTGALRALLVTLPFSYALAWLYSYVRFAASSIERSILTSMYADAADPAPFWWQQLSTATASDLQWSNIAYDWTGAAVLAGFVGVAIVVAYRSHRSAEHGIAVAARRMVGLAVYVLAGSAVSSAVPAALRWFLLTH